MSDRSRYPSKLKLDVDTLLHKMRVRYSRDFCLSAEPHSGYRSTVLYLSAGSHAFVLKIVGVDQWNVRSIETIKTLRTLNMAVPVPIALDDGDIAWRDNGSIHVLYERDSGTPPTAGDLDTLQAAGRKLGEIHHCRSALLTLPTTTFAEIVADTDREAEENGWASDLPSLPKVEDVDGGRPSLLHGDYRGQNVLFVDGEVSCVLDWDDAVMGPRLFDLAYGALFFLSVIRDDPPSADEVRAFLAGYSETYPVLSGEWEHFELYLRVALHQGLVLWMTIRSEVSDPATVARVSRWIDGYRALGPKLDGFGPV